MVYILISYNFAKREVDPVQKSYTTSWEAVLNIMPMRWRALTRRARSTKGLPRTDDIFEDQAHRREHASALYRKKPLPQTLSKQPLPQRRYEIINWLCVSVYGL